MGNFLSRIKVLMYYMDTEPLEIMCGIFKISFMLQTGLIPVSVSLGLTGLISILAGFHGSLTWRNLTNLVSTTVPIALIAVNLSGTNDHGHSGVIVLSMIASAWCLVRTMIEMKNRGYK